ncbi:helix-turn-helix transcriptional regulator [Polaribacter batillariae]|uniref:Helix-turn-helix transcriptional regulator n=1 Tax=Polaribacter batillariae TaxID=2808900 RepID=A0ABX7SSB1_9FLAO|nr:helix-turn-helix transcriptional regulator [Polaribacter batillariae]QTD37147.1 helix-turn-helix transcriptional regulator [Polaribacter batillariae]
MEIFFFIGIIICSFLASLIFTKNKNNKSDIVFGIWQIVLVVHFSLLYIRHSGLIEDFPHFLGLDTPFVLIHMPFIYFYTECIVYEKIRKKYLTLSLLPFIGMIFILSLKFFILSGNEKLMIYKSQLSGEKLYSITDIILFIQCFLYLPICYKLVKIHSNNIESKFSNIDRISLKWLETIILGATIVFGLIFLFYLFYFFSKDLNYETIGKISVVGICVFQAVLGYYGIRRTSLFHNSNDFVLDVKTKYKKTGLSKSMAEKYYNDLCIYMEKEKPFLDSELTLTDLSKQIDVKPNQLSQVINQFSDKNFYSYVNGYRINTVAKMLKDKSKDHISILGLAYDAGFKSKSVFNSLFKSIYGITPSQYKKRINN